jgi:hypothetical protein
MVARNLEWSSDFVRLGAPFPQEMATLGPKASSHFARTGLPVFPLGWGTIFRIRGVALPGPLQRHGLDGAGGIIDFRRCNSLDTKKYPKIPGA